MEKLIIGSRGSKLAVTQTQWVARQIQKHHPSLEIQFRQISTTGDRDQHSSLTAIGGKGVFVKEIEEALLAQSIDLAVHSLKDVPQVLPDGLILGPTPEQEDGRDALITRFGEQLNELPRGSMIGTSSPRRRAQLLRNFEKRQYKIVDLRGNLDTRVRKVKEGQVDAIIVAAAGLKRIGLEQEITQILEPEIMMPAPGQGCLALEHRIADIQVAEVLKAIKHEPSDVRARAERTFLQALGGNCTVPLGSVVQIDQEILSMKALLLDGNGKRAVYVEESGPLSQPELVGAKCAGRLIAEASDLL